ncbi:MAG: type III pantothenate kinase [Lachnospiraceae bacterium]|nr:type III pantothenate kinase [Lachnospiraceae bacterium]
MPVLVIDVGNTSTVFGLMDGTVPVFTWRAETDDRKTDLEYMVDLKTLFDTHGIPLSSVEACVTASAVPKTDAILESALVRLFSKVPLRVTPGTCRLEIRMDHPEELGGSLAASAMAVLREYPLPAAVVRLGTATTVSVLDEEGRCTGGAMIPGLVSSLNALTGKAAALPDTSVTAPTHRLGTNTADCLNAGAFYGHAGMIDGLLTGMEEAYRPFRSVVMTGRLSEALQPFLRHPAVCDRDLTLRGLVYILEENRRARP